MNLKSWIAAAVLVGTLLCAGSVHAQTGPQRAWGLGTGLGGGFSSAQVATTAGTSAEPVVGATINLPTFEAHIFIPRGWSVDLSFSLTDMILIGALAGAFYTELATFFSFYFGRGRIKAIVSPGVGFDVLGASGIFGFAFSVPVRVGVEFLSRSHGFGFRLTARPFFAVAYASVGDESGTAVGGGALAELGFSFYSVL